MRKTGTLLADWAVNKIKTEYKEDICLLLEHKTLRLDKDLDASGISYYIPATSKSNGFAKTFIIDGVSYDLFPMSWERMEKMSDVKDYNTTCLADAEILYARNDDDRQRFTSLQEKLQANLHNPHYMYNRALKWFDTVVEIYQETLFEESICKVRENAGYICDLLAITVAFVNQTYFKHGQTNQINEIKSMKEVPHNFVSLYESIIRAKTVDEQRCLCHDIIKTTKEFLAAHDKDATKKVTSPHFSELALWYQELCYTWRRVYHWCDANDPINAYIWCCNLQNEVNKVGSDYGITDLDIFSSYNPDDLNAFKKRAKFVEQKFINAIEANGVSIDSYETIEDFLKKNP